MESARLPPSSGSASHELPTITRHDIHCCSRKRTFIAPTHSPSLDHCRSRGTDDAQVAPGGEHRGSQNLQIFRTPDYPQFHRCAARLHVESQLSGTGVPVLPTFQFGARPTPSISGWPFRVIDYEDINHSLYGLKFQTEMFCKYGENCGTTIVGRRKARWRHAWSQESRCYLIRDPGEARIEGSSESGLIYHWTLQDIFECGGELLHGDSCSDQVPWTPLRNAAIVRSG
jgi:hypothetical protein